MSTERDLEIVEREIGQINAERTRIFKEIEPLQKQQGKLFEELKPLMEHRGDLLVAKMKANGPDWKLMLKEVASNSCSGVLLNYFNHLVYDLGLYHSGYWNDTVEACLQVKVERNDKSEKLNVDAIKFFAKILTPHKFDYDFEHNEGKAERVWFGLFEHTLSAYRVYRLEVSPDLTDIVLTSGGNYGAVDRVFKTVEEAVAYIRQYHWYGDSPSEED